MKENFLILSVIIKKAPSLSAENNVDAYYSVSYSDIVLRSVYYRWEGYAESHTWDSINESINNKFCIFPVYQSSVFLKEEKVNKKTSDHVNQAFTTNKMQIVTF